MVGFFTAGSTQPTSGKTSLVPLCGACGLFRSCKSPKMSVTGEGKLGVLIVAEAPGSDEDDEGVQLIGKAGQHLRKHLRRLCIDLDRDCWKTNAIICRPSDSKGKNRPPSNAEIGYCRPNLLQALKLLKPRVIIPLGGAAVESLIGHLWREDVGGISRWAGFQIPCQRPNVWICPTYHPSYLIREEDEALELWFERHLEAAFNLTSRPWTETQEWDKEVRIVMDDEVASETLKVIGKKEVGVISFDYETTTLKPDTPWSEIICCAITWGTTVPMMTIAFPWRGKARLAMQEIIRGPLPKIAQNAKFEDRWTRKEFGHRVRNWVWDTMLAAHWMDNRPHICGLKFQAFVHLGYPSYDDEVRLYLQASDSRTKNRVAEVDISKLLKYNGLDALLEFRLAVRQHQIVGHDFRWKVREGV